MRQTAPAQAPNPRQDRRFETREVIASVGRKQEASRWALSILPSRPSFDPFALHESSCPTLISNYSSQATIAGSHFARTAYHWPAPEHSSRFRPVLLRVPFRGTRSARLLPEQGYRPRPERSGDHRRSTKNPCPGQTCPIAPFLS